MLMLRFNNNVVTSRLFMIMRKLGSEISWEMNAPLCWKRNKILDGFVGSKIELIMILHLLQLWKLNYRKIGKVLSFYRVF